MMSGNIHFHDFNSSSELVEILSQNIAKNLQDAIDKKGSAILSVSGGSTPKPLFKELRQIDIEWKKVTITLCDERWVDSTHEDSNEKFVKTYLMQDKASEAKFIGMYIDTLEAKEAEKECSKNIELSDVLILGMGGDAHTASLFPRNPKLESGFDMNNPNRCIAIEPKNAPHMRMSLTLNTILNSNHLYLHFEGESKLAVYQEALDGEDIYTMPIRSILHQDQKIVEVYYA